MIWKNGKFKFLGNFILSIPLNKGNHFRKFGTVMYRHCVVFYYSIYLCSVGCMHQLKLTISYAIYRPAAVNICGKVSEIDLKSAT